MTDQELSALGARLYNALIAAQLSEPALQDLAEAIETQRPWSVLADRTKISIFVVASQLERGDLAREQVVPEHGLIEPPPSVETAGDDAAGVFSDLPPETELTSSVEHQESPPDADAVSLDAVAEEPGEEDLEETKEEPARSMRKSEATPSS